MAHDEVYRHGISIYKSDCITLKDEAATDLQTPCSNLSSKTRAEADLRKVSSKIKFSGGCELSENLRQTREQEEESRRSSPLRVPLESTAIYFWFSTLACSAAKSRLTVFTRFLKVRRDSETRRQVFLLLFADVHKASFAGRTPKRRLWYSPRSPRLVWLAICGVRQEICPKH